jgi:class 3 adenylate cyclase/predicted ATPase
MDIAGWLRDLGLERYEQAFRANEIDAEILPKLTDEHLKELGLPLGPRLKLLEAIAALPAPREAPMPPSDDVRATPAPGPPAAPPNQAERRQLTVMFVDLVGSTALTGRLDPEDMGAVLRVYQDTCAGVITRFEGHIAKYMGDGVLAYFGYPLAHEDDAERAVRAGLGITEAVGRLAAPAGTPLAARVGIATGPVVVGDLVGAGAAREETVVGETPNLAARLQNLAPPGGVVVSRRTRRLVGGLFETADLGSHQLKGFERPIQVWRVLGPSTAEGRFEARKVMGLTPLVGREEELALLLRRWELARDGEGQVVLLCGEPGIGKSRLIQSLRARLGDEAYTPLSHLCSPYHVSSALHPVIRSLERGAGLRRDDPPERQLDKLEALLALAAEDVGEVAPLVADLLAIPTEGRYPPLDLSPERLRERTLQALVAQLEGLAARQPILASFEDAHWIDPSTLELLGQVIERAPRLPALVVITFRPEFTPPWTGYAHVTSLSLSRLGRRQITALVERVTRGKALPAEVVAQILAKTDGVPLFVEELTKALLESELLKEEGDRYALTGPLPPLAIPATLQDSLMARLDRSAPVKEVAQVAAAIGREFSHELLTAVAPLEEAKLRDRLDQLVASELVFRRGTPPDAIYTFKHALVQDAAYASLLKNRRQQLHAKITAALEERFPEVAETQPGLLARHCTEAGLVDQAIGYWLKAGQQAVARSAMLEAIAQLTRGLELLARLTDEQERRPQELYLQVTLAGALIAAKGASAPEVGLIWTRARELCREVPDSEQLVRVLNGQFFFHIVRAELADSLGIGEELLCLAGQGGNVIARLIGHRAAGYALVATGELARGREHFEQALVLYDPARHRGLAIHHIFDPQVGSLSFLSLTLLALGYPTQALHRNSESIREARQLGHPLSLALALFFNGVVRQLLGGWEDVLDCADELLAVASEQDFRLWLARAEGLRGWALARAGSTEEGSALLRRGLTDYRATGAGQYLPYFLALLSEAAGPGAEALEFLEDALARAEQSGERWFEAELHRRKGEGLLTLAAARPAEAEACFGRALAVARGQGARMWELRAATSLTRLWRDQGKRAEAHDLLAPVYSWFTEGFDAPDLKEAKGLLDSLQ